MKHMRIIITLVLLCLFFTVPSYARHNGRGTGLKVWNNQMGNMNKTMGDVRNNMQSRQQDRQERRKDLVDDMRSNLNDRSKNMRDQFKGRGNHMGR